MPGETTPAGLAASDAAALRQQLVALHRQRLDDGRRMIAEAEAALAVLGAPAGLGLAAHEPPGLVPGERMLSLKAAAHEVGMSQRALRRRIARHSLEHPERPPLAIQPGAIANARYVVPMGRLWAYLRTGA
ncbi:hypothetical protein ACQVP2_07380 [Methylobacterium aquaticum]|uniref:hypothetical protein n=1 Tax=Methylobacterium aquaticum TaxID=270351 RepID=UPI003D16A0F6